MSDKYHVEAQSALSLGIIHDKVHDADCYADTVASALLITATCSAWMDRRTRQHILVPTQYLIVTSIRRGSALIDNSAIRIHDPICRHRSVGGGALERKLACKLAVHGTWEMDTKSELALLQNS